jgi:hypothetical protein
MQDPEKLGRIAVALVVTFGNKTTWDDLPPEKAKALRSALNDGIPEADVELREAVMGDFVAIAATYRDEENDFTAEYLLFQNDVVFSYEN